MVKVASCFAQVLSLVPRAQFERAVRAHAAERDAKGFACWDQFVAMLFCQMGAANSLREICGGLATALGKLVHLGMKAAPPRSTLAYANAHRPWQLYETVFLDLLQDCQAEAQRRGRRFRFKDPLRILDASVIPLCLQTFDWARFRRTKGAVKLHLQLDHQGCLPCWALVTEGRVHDLKAAQSLTFAPGTIVVMDCGYNDYALLGRWNDAGAYFVTRPKDNLDYAVEQTRPLPDRGPVRRDEIIRLTGVRTAQRYPQRLRRLVVWDAENQRELVLISNLLHFAARTIAAIYKERWQIELFFKALKQNLKLKTFVGTSENAVQIQIWTALIAMLLLKYLQLRSTWAWSLSNLAAMLRFNLLTYRDLWAWLNQPYQVPRLEPAGCQLTFLVT